MARKIRPTEGRIGIVDFEEVQRHVEEMARAISLL